MMQLGVVVETVSEHLVQLTPRKSHIDAVMVGNFLEVERVTRRSRITPAGQLVAYDVTRETGRVEACCDGIKLIVTMMDLAVHGVVAGGYITGFSGSPAAPVPDPVTDLLVGHDLRLRSSALADVPRQGLAVGYPQPLIARLPLRG